MSYGAPQHGIGDGGERPAPNVPPGPAVGFAIDLADPANPAVILRFGNDSLTTDVRILASAAEPFARGLAAGIVQAARQAVIAAGPRLVVPPGSLIVPTPGGIPRPNGSRS